MRDDLKSIQSILEDKIDDIIDKLIYEVERYNKACSLALIYSFDNIDADKIKEIVRKSDILIKIVENAVFIIYTNTPKKSGIKATERIIVELNPDYKFKMYASIEECLPNSTKSILICNLFNLIDFSIDNGHENEVIDIYYLDSIY